MRKGQRNELQRLPISFPLTVDMLTLTDVADAAGVNVFTLHRWKRRGQIVIELDPGCVVTIRRA